MTVACKQLSGSTWICHGKELSHAHSKPINFIHYKQVFLPLTPYRSRTSYKKCVKGVLFGATCRHLQFATVTMTCSLSLTKTMLFISDQQKLTNNSIFSLKRRQNIHNVTHHFDFIRKIKRIVKIRDYVIWV